MTTAVSGAVVVFVIPSQDTDEESDEQSGLQTQLGHSGRIHSCVCLTRKALNL